MDIVSFFNHKGGVGKTTLVFNIGLALAQMGTRVLFVDLDAQANLTSVALGAEDLEERFNRGDTIYSCVAPVIDGSGEVRPRSPAKIRENAWLLPGDIRLSEFEEICPQGWTETLAGAPRGFRVSTALFRLIEAVGAEVSADIALLDLGPNVGALNRTAILASDGFVIPMAPDLFSVTALASVGKSTSLWVEEWRAARGSADRRRLNLDFMLPVGLPAPLGYISQQFAIYRQAPAEAYKRWIDRIPGSYQEGIVDPLTAAGVNVPHAEPKIGEVRNLSSLIPMAQQERSAIFELSGTEARGSQYTRARQTLSLFTTLAERIIERLEVSGRKA